MYMYLFVIYDIYILIFGYLVVFWETFTYIHFKPLLPDLVLILFFLLSILIFRSDN